MPLGADEDADRGRDQRRRSSTSSSRVSVASSKPTGTRARHADAITISSGSGTSAAVAAVTSTKESGDGFVISTARDVDDRVCLRGLFGSPPASRHLHHHSERALSPVSEANSFALRPLSFQRSIRFAHASRAASSIVASGAETYASAALVRNAIR